MAYTGSPSTNTSDAIRLLIGDVSTSTSAEIFSDAEITYFSGAYANAELAASAAVSSLIGSTRALTLAGVVRKSVGDLKLDYGGNDSPGAILARKAKYLRRLGVRRVKPYAGGISESDMDSTTSDTDRVAPAFAVGQFDYTSSTSTY